MSTDPKSLQDILFWVLFCAIAAGSFLVVSYALHVCCG